MEANEFEEYARRPFVVQAVEIDEDNIEHVSSFIGNIVELEDGSVYIDVDRRLAPGTSRAYIGDFVTNIGNRYRVYTPKKFRELYVRNTGDIQAWIDFLAREDAA